MTKNATVYVGGGYQLLGTCAFFNLKLFNMAAVKTYFIHFFHKIFVMITYFLGKLWQLCKYLVQLLIGSLKM